MTANRGSYSKYWVFTLNNPEDNDIPKEWPEVEFCFWQLETGDSGTPHLQGYVAFTSNKRMTWLKKQCHPRCHWENRKGNHEQAKHYNTKPHVGCECEHCKKNRNGRLAGPWDIGTVPESMRGKRTDMLSLKRKLDSGATLADVARDDETFAVVAKYYRWIPLYLSLTGKQRDWATETVVYWGAPGIGKSRRVRHEAGPDAFWLSKPGGQTCWWDGYIGQAVVVIDEFYGWIARDLMCRICDRYPLNVETKGGSQPFLAKKIFITSNEHPSAWWSKIGLGAMTRRLSAPLGCVIEMTIPWYPTLPPLTPISEATIDSAAQAVSDLWCDEEELAQTPVEQPDPPVDMPVQQEAEWPVQFGYIDVRPLGGNIDYESWGGPFM